MPSPHSTPNDFGISWLLNIERREAEAADKLLRTRIEEVLTARRPLLAESPRRVALMESEQMKNIGTAAGTVTNDAKVVYLSPAEARRRAFAIMQRHTAVMAEPGTAACVELMHRLVDAYATPVAVNSNVRPVAAGLEVEAMAMLRARCAICPERCERPIE
jgi:hypothetical protein